MTRASAVRLRLRAALATGAAALSACAMTGSASAAPTPPFASAPTRASAPARASAPTRASTQERASSARSAPGAAGRERPSARCLPDDSAYLRAQLRGAIAADIDWRGAALECEGGMRPDGHGIRASFAGPLRSGGATHRLRLIFGIAAAGEGRPGRAVPANVTLIVEGEQRVYSTRGDDKCTVDRLDQQPLARTGRRRDYRIIARGFCVGPAGRLEGAPADHVLVSRFDFNGRITLYTDAADAPADGIGAGRSDSRRSLP